MPKQASRNLWRRRVLSIASEGGSNGSQLLPILPPANSPAQIEEARRLAQQADSQVKNQLEMIERMKRSGLSTAVAEEALRMMRNIAVQMQARLNSMTGAAKAD